MTEPEDTLLHWLLHKPLKKISGLYFINEKAEALITCPKLPELGRGCFFVCYMMLPLHRKEEGEHQSPLQVLFHFRPPKDPSYWVSYLAPEKSPGREMKKWKSSKHIENSILLRTAIQSTWLCISDILITENSSSLLRASRHISAKFLMACPLQFQFYPRTHAPQHGQLSSIAVMAKFNSLQKGAGWKGFLNAFQHIHESSAFNGMVF